jgi:hypothetical protein
MQGSNNFWRHPRVGVAFLLKLMIKEDHLLACTTKMFEILVAFHKLENQLASGGICLSELP